MEKINKTLIIGINLGDFGSTGTIMRNELEYAHEHGNYDYLVCVPKDEGKQNTYVYTYTFCKLKRGIYNRILKIEKRLPDGYYYIEYTRRLINKIKEWEMQYNKVIIHLHNMHMAGICFPMLFKYLSKTGIKVFYTLHDAWPFTGGCYCFNFIKCFEWQNGCKCKCCQKCDTKLINVQKNWKLKKKYTSMLRKDQLTLIPVSHWMNDNLKHSFLNDYSSIVNPGECSITSLKEPDFELKHSIGLDDKRIVITVSAYWNDWKGYKYLYQIAEKFPNDYVLLIIGGFFDTKNQRNILHVDNVNNQELARYFSFSDVFISTTQDDNLPLVLMEAQICGLPIVGFGHGGTPEEIIEGKTGYMVGTDNDVNKLFEAIVRVVEDKPFKKEDIINNGNRFKKYEHAKSMFDIYESTKW